MIEADRIVVGVPVWHGTAFVAETMESILSQTHRGFTCIVSVDGNDVESERACQPYLRDPRVRVRLQSRRLGWVANTALLHAAAIAEGAPFACIQPHDDLMDRDYLAALLAAMRDNPDAAVGFTDIRTFGEADNRLVQSPVTGAAAMRMLALVRDHFSAVAYRGLTRIAALKAVRPISGNPYFDFAADTVWMTRMATVGELIRVPTELYRKRLHADSTHRQWFTWSRAQRTAAWTDHCLRMLAEAFAAVPDLATRITLVDAARQRLTRMGRHVVGLPSPLPDDAMAGFDAAVATMLTRPARPPAPRP